MAEVMPCDSGGEARRDDTSTSLSLGTVVLEPSWAVKSPLSHGEATGRGSG